MEQKKLLYQEVLFELRQVFTYLRIKLLKSLIIPSKEILLYP